MKIIVNYILFYLFSVVRLSTQCNLNSTYNLFLIIFLWVLWFHGNKNVNDGVDGEHYDDFYGRDQTILRIAQLCT